MRASLDALGPLLAATLELLDVPVPWWPWVGVGVASVVSVGLGTAAGLRVARWRVARRTARSRALGRRGERDGRRLLERGGYRVLAEQVTGEVVLWVDGRRRTFTVRADALVERRRRRYIAEYKGGPDVARVSHRGTRRQLLEYAHAFDIDGVVLVDAVSRRIEHVEW